MKQSAVTAPLVTSGPGLFAAFRIHVLASLFRNYVWWLSGNGSDFDEVVYVDTPGLGSGRVRCAICYPANDTSLKSCPLLLVFEGGGFILGQPEDGQRQDRRLADELGLVVISVDYAKAPRYPFPHALLQLLHVLEWATSGSNGSLKVQPDASKVAFMGNSAGGNLVAALTLLVAFTEGPLATYRHRLPATFRQVAQVMLYPSLDTGVPYGERFERASKAVQEQSLPVGVAQLMEDAYLPPHISRDHLLIRPTLAAGDILSELRLPPALILTAGMDCLKEEADTYTRQLGQVGVTVHAHDYPQAKHGFSHYKKGKDYRKEDVEDCWKRIAGMLREAFI